MMTPETRPLASRRIAFWSILIALVALGAYVPVEIAYRGYLYYKYAILNDFQGIAITDVRMIGKFVDAEPLLYGPFPPSSKITTTHYNQADEPYNRHTLWTNNFGRVSRFDYTRDKAEGEYRIAVVGASLTMSSNNGYPWPDELQRELNQDQNFLQKLGVDRVTVLNLGLGGASIPIVASEAIQTASRFSSDFVVVGFSTPFLDQFKPADALKTLDTMMSYGAANPAAPTRITHPHYETPPADIVIDGMEAWLGCTSAPRKLANPACHVNPQWYVPPGREIGQQEFRALKRELARRVILHRVILSWRPTALLELLGTPIISSAAAGDLPKSGPQSTGQNLYSETMLKIWQKVKAAQPNLMLTHDPILWEPRDRSGPPVLNNLLPLAKERGLDLVRMADYLPLQLGEREWRNWYLADGHWSDNGARVFAKALAQALRPRLLASRGLPGNEDTACEPAYRDFQRANGLKVAGDKAGALTSLGAALDKLPAAMRSNVENASAFAELPYAHCGFVPDLRIDRVLLLEELGQPVEADERRAALNLAVDSTVYQGQRAARLAQIGDHKGAIEAQTELIRLDPNRMDVYMARATELMAAGNPADALKDVAVVLKAKPRDDTALFMRCQLRSMVGDHRGVIADATELLKRFPGNESFIYFRLSSEIALRDYDAAKADLKLFEKAAPNHPALPAFKDQLKVQGASAGGTSERKSDTHQARAAELMRSGDYQGALKEIGLALERKPDDDAAIFVRCQLRSVTGDHHGVIADATDLLNHFPNNASFIYLRLGSEIALGEFDRASADLAALIKMAPEHPAIPVFRAQLERKSAQAP